MIKENEKKEKIIKEYKRILQLALKSKLNAKNKITTINAWAVTVFRYRTGMRQCKEIEFKDVNKKSSKTMTIIGALHPKSDVDKLCIGGNRDSEI